VINKCVFFDRGGQISVGVDAAVRLPLLRRKIDQGWKKTSF